MAWPFGDCYAKEELVDDQFLIGMDSHELSVQVVTHGHCQVEDVLHIARSLEAMHEEDNLIYHARKPTTQARFATNKPAETLDTEYLVIEVLPQLGHDFWPGCFPYSISRLLVWLVVFHSGTILQPG